MAVAAQRRSPAPAKGAPGSRPVARSRGGSWEFFKSLLGALAIFLVVRTFFLEAYRIPSSSMTPTLLVGDWLFVNKLVYGPHLPFTSVTLPGYEDPDRGDIAVFVSPTQIDQPWDPNPTLVKRVAGEPGDTLHMRGGLLFVNGLAQRQGFAAGVNPIGDGDAMSPLFDWQHRHAIAASRFGPPPVQPTLDDWGPLVVPPEHYFMLGDNRYQSKDSRFWGLVPRDNFRGRPLFVYYSYNADDSDRPLPFLTDIRWSRIGHVIR